MSRPYFKSTDDAYTEADRERGLAKDGAVSEQHPLPIQVAWRSEGDEEWGSADEAHGLPVQVQGTARTTTALYLTPFTEIPGIAPADALDAGDAMGLMGSNSLDIEGNPLPRRGIIIGAKLLDRDDDTLSATVHVFHRPLLTAQTSDSALAINDADAVNWVTSIVFASTTDIGGSKVSEVNDWDAPYYSPTATIYWQFSTAGTPTIAAGSMPLVQFIILGFADPSD